MLAKRIYPHGKGEDTHGAEASTAVASHEDGGDREDHLEGGGRDDRCVLPSGQTNQVSGERERDERIDSWQWGASVKATLE